MALKSAVDFFYEGAGYSYPQGATKKQIAAARQANAEALADAEEQAWERDWYYEWTPSEDPGEDGEYYDGVLYDADGSVLASLGEVDLSGDSNDHRRVVEAELALWALGEMKPNASTTGDLEVLINPKRVDVQAALDRVQKRARQRTISASDVLDLLNDCEPDGYAAVHGGGVPNNYSYAAESTAALAVCDGADTVVVIGRGRAPSGAGGAVGPSVRPQLGAPWGSLPGRYDRLRAWVRELQSEMKPNKRGLGKAAERWVHEIVRADPSVSKSKTVELAYRNAAAEDPSLWSQWRAFKKAADKAYDAHPNARRRR